jgi:ABC-type uncharacterized transport system substrate-binding protein
MRRREFIAGIGSVAALPSGVSAQQANLPFIGILHAGSPAASAEQIEGFRKGLAEVGYTANRNVAIEVRWAEGRYDELPAMAADLIRRQVTILVTGGGPATALAAKAATTTTPIVFVTGDDPVKHGLVASINRPGGNLTGAAFFNVALVAKRFELIRELVPQASSFAFLADPKNPETEIESKDLQTAVHAAHQKLTIVSSPDESGFEGIFANLAQQRVDALLVASGPFLFGRRGQLISLAARHKIPTIYPIREYVTPGGLISYGNSIPDAYRQVGVYAGRILKGAKPADLPVVQPIKFDLVINLKTAKALGLEVPAHFQQRADDVIE